MKSISNKKIEKRLNFELDIYNPLYILSSYELLQKKM